ncbi:uncharacterized protein N7458_001118 [Penicillium daleae]|uniref:Uncharacterized protein n=1 Tax=Penicillium daleae TaxID=63821 RepID=A0AAD6CB32_9EURO|nr:uncharacterized protein N7458_001118 [Penicillium daleae]KAJ5459566.1 hypothetical protein N7458_001118 [Penicillium daleae]
MKLTSIILALAASALAVQPQRRDTVTVAATTTTDPSGFNIGEISSALANLSTNTTATANFGNISPPPKSLIPEILSVVPVTVLWDLINAQSRSSLASAFSAGSTPAWYSSLPADVKSYMSVVKSQISGGALTATTGLAYETSSASTSSGSGATTGTAGGSSTSTSKGLAASQPTGLTASVIGAVGVLGLALVL